MTGLRTDFVSCKKVLSATYHLSAPKLLQIYFVQKALYDTENNFLLEKNKHTDM